MVKERLALFCKHSEATVYRDVVGQAFTWTWRESKSKNNKYILKNVSKLNVIGFWNCLDVYRTHYIYSQGSDVEVAITSCFTSGKSPVRFGIGSCPPSKKIYIGNSFQLLFCCHWPSHMQIKIIVQILFEDPMVKWQSQLAFWQKSPVRFGIGSFYLLL